MQKNGFKTFFRVGGRGKFSDDHVDDETDSILGYRDERVVRMGGDTMMAGIRPRISFKPKAKITFNRNLHHAFENVALDDMLMHSNNNKDEGYERQVIFRGRGRSFNGRLCTISNIDLRDKLTQVVVADANWYRVTIPCGAKYGKEFILQSIMDYIAPETFVPILYENQEKSSTFYVDDNKTAKKLLSCDDKIYLSNNFRLHVYVKPGFPQCKIDDTLKERIGLAMTKRYNQETNSLDLSFFHRDQDLAEKYFCALYQPFMLTTVFDIAAENVPSLEALNLEGNKFNSIDRLSSLKQRFENLKILYLGDNQLREMSQIDPIKNLKLEELRLKGNPLCDKYAMQQNEYVNEVRQRFPKLLRLDSVELPPPIVFELVEEEFKMPTSKKNFSVNEETNNIAIQFLQQYFAIFDSGDRQQLINAYHEKALFSMTVSSSLAARPTSYLGENRNLLRVNDPLRRRKLLRRGRLAVLSAISEFPRTRHDGESFTMDVSVYSESMMLITLTGLFKEIENTEAPTRYFNRVFTIVPVGDGYCILNEQIHLHNPTQLQHKRALINLGSEKVEISTPESSMNAGNSPALTLEAKERMIETLSSETNMNKEWSFKCLNEVQWNYENGLAAFQQFFQQGLIPAEAFQK